MIQDRIAVQNGEKVARSEGWKRPLIPISYLCADCQGAHINGISNVQESKPSHLADASSGQEPIWHRAGEELPNSQAVRPTSHSKPNVLESRHAEGKVLGP